MGDYAEHKHTFPTRAATRPYSETLRIIREGTPSACHPGTDPQVLSIAPDGTKELVAMADGYRESSESWAGLLRDRARRGMRAPVLAVGDGALGEHPALHAAGAGFTAEDAMGCFADATAWQSLTEPFHRYLTDVAGAGFGGPPIGRDTKDLCEGHFELTHDEERRADLLTFGVPEGWGQVWAGRARDGEIAVIVAPGPAPTSPWD